MTNAQNALDFQQRYVGNPYIRLTSPASNDENGSAKVGPDVPVGTRREERYYGQMMVLMRLPGGQLRWVPAPRDTPDSPPRLPPTRRREDSELGDRPKWDGNLLRHDPLYMRAMRAWQEREGIPTSEENDSGDDEVDDNRQHSDNDASISTLVLPSIEEEPSPPTNPTKSTTSQLKRAHFGAQSPTLTASTRASRAQEHRRRRRQERRNRRRGQPTVRPTTQQSPQIPAPRQHQGITGTSIGTVAAQAAPQQNEIARQYTEALRLWREQRQREIELFAQYYERQRILEAEERDWRWRNMLGGGIRSEDDEGDEGGDEDEDDE